MSKLQKDWDTIKKALEQKKRHEFLEREKEKDKKKRIKKATKLK